MNQKQMFQNRTKLLAVQIIEITNLWQETDEILAMTIASIKTLRNRQSLTKKSSIVNQQS